MHTTQLAVAETGLHAFRSRFGFRTHTVHESVRTLGCDWAASSTSCEQPVTLPIEPILSNMSEFSVTITQRLAYGIRGRRRGTNEWDGWMDPQVPDHIPDMVDSCIFGPTDIDLSLQPTSSKPAPSRDSSIELSWWPRSCSLRDSSGLLKEMLCIYWAGSGPGVAAAG